MSELTSREYWDRIQGKTGRGLRVDSEFARLTKPYLKGRILELGCGDSHILPYWVKQGYDVSGIDYSPQRIMQTSLRLEAHHLAADLKCCDFYDIPNGWQHSFDVVYSGGVIEHFNDAKSILRLFQAYMKDDGVMITTVPHLKGMWGGLGKMLNPKADAGYVRMDLGDLAFFHRQVGLRIVFASYFRWMDFSILNYDRITIKRAVYGLVSCLDAVRPKRRGLPQFGYADMLVVAKKC